MNTSPSSAKKKHALTSKRNHTRTSPLRDNKKLKSNSADISHQNVEEKLDRALAKKDWALAQKWVDGNPGANLSLKDGNGRTRLHRACLDNNVLLVKNLIGLGASTDILDQNEETALGMACRKGHHEVIKALLRAEANPNVLNRMSLSPLNYAIKQGDLATLNLLLDNRANPNKYDVVTKSPLYCALYENGQLSLNEKKIDMALSLLKANARVSFITRANLGELFIECCKYHNGILLIHAMKEAGVDFTKETHSGEPLMFAVMKRRPQTLPSSAKDIVRFFIHELGFDPRQKHPHTGASLLHHAKNILDAAAIIDAGVPVNSVNKDDVPAVFRAAEIKHYELVKYFKSRGANMSYVTEQQLNMIHYANLARDKSYTKKIKSMVGLQKSHLKDQKDKMRALLKRCQEVARAQGKPLLILIGEAHGCYPVYQVEKMIYQIARELGLKNYFLEMKMENVLMNRGAHYMPLKHLRKQKGIHLIGVDNGASKESIPFNMSKDGMAYRDVMMSDCMTQVKADGVLTTGAMHLFGLLERHSSKLDRNKFFIVPFNLAPLHGIDMTVTPEGRYIINPDNVIQIDSKGYFDEKAVKVVESINQCEIEQKEKRKSPKKSRLSKKSDDFGCVIC